MNSIDNIDCPDIVLKIGSSIPQIENKVPIK